jgi:uncharacterized protein (TIGR02118 family)
MIKLVYIVRKRDDVSAADFHTYWLEKHGPLVRSVAQTLRARKYVQSHTIAPEVGASIAQARGMGEGYDGITEVWWNSPDDLTASFGSAEGRAAGARLVEDESKFIDLKRSYIFLTEEHTIFDFAPGKPA